MKPSFHFTKHALRRILGAAALLPLGLFAQTFFQPYGSVFAPSGQDSAPWTLLNAAVSASNGGEVRVLGNINQYGPTRIDQKCKLTRNPGDGAVKLGATPLDQTSLRCVFYNARLNGNSGIQHALPLGWADEQRAVRIRDYNFGSPDFIGYCEVWNGEWFARFLRNTPGMPHNVTGFGTCYRSEPNVCADLHSGLCAVSRWPLSLSVQDSFARNAAGEDFSFANKGWLKTRMTRQGFNIWIFVVHTQADAQTSWANINFYRAAQVDMLVADITRTRNDNPGDPVVMLGDFNVYGEDRSPGGLQTEYSQTLRAKLQAIGGLDIAKHFFPQRTEHTYSKDNSLIAYWDRGYDTDTYSGRLDYMFCFSSGNRKVLIEPTDYAVIRASASPPITGQEYNVFGYIRDTFHTDANLSDHYAIRGDFRIVRTSN
jgi:endonuclease/exonuclease/phosphatase family metal-dependent hydrolase